MAASAHDLEIVTFGKALLGNSGAEVNFSAEADSLILELRIWMRSTACDLKGMRFEGYAIRRVCGTPEAEI